MCSAAQRRVKGTGSGMGQGPRSAHDMWFFLVVFLPGLFTSHRQERFPSLAFLTTHRELPYRDRDGRLPSAFSRADRQMHRE